MMMIEKMKCRGGNWFRLSHMFIASFEKNEKCPSSFISKVNVYHVADNNSVPFPVALLLWVNVSNVLPMKDHLIESKKKSYE